MKAISIWQPHATLLLLGPKRYETRGWTVPRTLLGKRVAIHAAKADGGLIEIVQYILARKDGIAADEAMDAYVAAIVGAGYRTCGEMPRGCIIGSVILCESLAAERAEDHNGFGYFSAGRFAWRVSDSKVLAKPVPFRGMQGFFDVPDELMAEAA
ncbi:hypothetical protein A8H39_00725 [Paraburkholderia fungorum]|uniref:hypothetical protein n=1 Tax=Paraburkholderia fungorum TaxID=134537 RepID=UPI00047F29C1|nr:hypothetical protein [Paraburkholderia fungorum]PNE59704.1 hypothetical protein A8H39_00725 [Paraburkholderia fungorum]